MTEDPTTATGSTRSHIVSRFHKAFKHASSLAALLSAAESNATSTDFLEATAYASSFKGFEALEKGRWEAALQAFAVSRIIYSTLSTDGKNDAFPELLTEIVEPSIRFSAYKLQLPRSMDIAGIARQYFPRDGEHSPVVAELEKLDPDVFAEPMETDSAGAAGTVTSVSWRGRTAPVEGADISVKLSNAQTAEAAYNSQDHQGSTDAFDAVLLAWQDAVDATRKAIDERQAEGMSMSDQKMQVLQLTWTVVNYSMICWRVGRNRVMISNIMSSPKKSSKKGGTVPVEEVSGKKIGHLKEEIALYDAILQVPPLSHSTHNLTHLTPPRVWSKSPTFLESPQTTISPPSSPQKPRSSALSVPPPSHAPTRSSATAKTPSHSSTKRTNTSPPRSPHCPPRPPSPPTKASRSLPPTPQRSATRCPAK